MVHEPRQSRLLAPPRSACDPPQICRQADGFQPHLVSPERGIKRLVQEAMLLTAPHVHRFVDEIHLVLLETVREAARRSVLTEAGIPLGSGPEPGKGMEFLRLKGFENAVIQAATKALDEWKAEAHKGECRGRRSRGAARGQHAQQAGALVQPAHTSRSKQLGDTGAAGQLCPMPTPTAEQVFWNEGAFVSHPRPPLVPPPPCSGGDDGADGVRLRDALLLPRAGEGVPERADERRRRAGRRGGAARRPHGTAGARCAAAAGQGRFRTGCWPCTMPV